MNVSPFGGSLGFGGEESAGASFVRRDGSVWPPAKPGRSRLCPSHQVKLTENNPYGFKATFNPTCPVISSNPSGWVSPSHYGLSQGPIILMIENYRSGLLWRLMRNCSYIASGLRRVGFNGGWLRTLYFGLAEDTR